MKTERRSRELAIEFDDRRGTGPIVDLVKVPVKRPNAVRIAARMVRTIALQKPKKCLCCGAPANEVAHD